MSRQSRVEALIEQERILMLPGVYDALSAKLVERAGFPLVFVSGFSVAAAQLGLPDFGYLTQTEMVAVARRVCSAVTVPVIIDADTGYGNALNVIRTVNELMDAGAAGMIMEDQVWPKRCGHMKGKRVIPAHEQVQKIRAAVEARGDRDFFIIARTDARQVDGLEAAITRCRRYKEAGADALFVEAANSEGELETIAKELPSPLVTNMLEGGVTPLLPKTQLEKLGFQLVVCSLSVLYASTKAVSDVLEVLQRLGTTKSELDRLTSFEQFSEVIGLEKHYALEHEYRSLDEGQT